MAELNTLRIGELAELTGTPTSTIRYYEKEGLLNTVQRTAGGNRRYNRDTVLRLQMIRSLQSLGFSLSEIPAMLRDSKQQVDPIQVMEQLDQRLLNVSQLISDLQNQHQRLSELKNILTSHWAEGVCLTDEQLVALGSSDIKQTTPVTD